VFASEAGTEVLVAEELIAFASQQELLVKPGMNERPTLVREVRSNELPVELVDLSVNAAGATGQER
jgi:hypothetical protein